MELNDRRSYIQINIGSNSSSGTPPHIEEKKGIKDKVSCEELTTKTDTKSFKVGIPFHKLEETKTKGFWPTVCIFEIVILLEPPRPFYELIPGLGHYKLHTNSKNWHNAKLICETEGAHLAIINSEDEVAILKEFRRRLPRLHSNYLDIIIYLGFNDFEEEGVWKTIFNKSLRETGFLRWEQDQPANSTNEDCGCINVDSGNLHDCICSDILPFFCERCDYLEVIRWKEYDQVPNNMFIRAFKNVQPCLKKYAANAGAYEEFEYILILWYIINLLLL
ncbi:hypothetical protein C0J52_09175 [Blattella germanica]|nr:hypothetical protein C0J52_09175 [Blattella germanica]